MFPEASERIVTTLANKNSLVTVRPSHCIVHWYRLSTINNTGYKQIQRKRKACGSFKATFWPLRRKRMNQTVLSPRNLAALQISPHEVVASPALKTQPLTEVSEPPRMMWRHPFRWWRVETQMAMRQWIEVVTRPGAAAPAPYWIGRRGEARGETPHVTTAPTGPMKWTPRGEVLG